MTQVINHDLGNNIVHNPGYDFDLGYKSFFYDEESTDWCAKYVTYIVIELWTK